MRAQDICRILIPMDSSRRAECVFAAGIALAQGETLLEHAGEDFLSGTEFPLLKPVIPLDRRKYIRNLNLY